MVYAPQSKINLLKAREYGVKVLSQGLSQWTGSLLIDRRVHHKGSTPAQTTFIMLVDE
jgi:hypothetical protein